VKLYRDKREELVESFPRFTGDELSSQHSDPGAFCQMQKFNLNPHTSRLESSMIFRVRKSLPLAKLSLMKVITKFHVQKIRWTKKSPARRGFLHDNKTWSQYINIRLGKL
jgi:hypothetical protein